MILAQAASLCSSIFRAILRAVFRSGAVDMTRQNALALFMQSRDLPRGANFPKPDKCDSLPLDGPGSSRLGFRLRGLSRIRSDRLEELPEVRQDRGVVALSPGQ